MYYDTGKKISLYNNNRSYKIREKNRISDS